MTRVVESVAPEFEDVLTWKKVVTKEFAGAQRYEQFSKLLGKPAPIPSIVINDELVFETIPSTEELKAFIEKIVKKLFFLIQK